VVLMRLDSVVVWTFHQGSFRGERVGTPFPLLERITDGIANHFPAKNALHCRILHIQYQFFSGVIPRTPQKCPRCFDPYTNFRLAHRAFPLFRFYETTTAFHSQSTGSRVLFSPSGLPTAEYGPGKLPLQPTSKLV